jgi:hypothetical protein
MIKISRDQAKSLHGSFQHSIFVRLLNKQVHIIRRQKNFDSEENRIMQEGVPAGFYISNALGNLLGFEKPAASERMCGEIVWPD